MRKLNAFGAVAMMCVLLGRTGVASGRETFETANLHGRYTGHLTVGANFSDGTTTQRLDVQLLSALIFDGKSAVTGTSIVTVAIPGQTPFTCPFAVTGTYDLGDAGLGRATIALAASDQTCGDGGGAGVTLQANLVVGGRNRRRLDVTINAATDTQGEVLPIIGAGTLEK
jgi:hypothetical protein